jgi:hypothetical protein
VSARPYRAFGVAAAIPSAAGGGDTRPRESRRGRRISKKSFQSQTSNNRHLTCLDLISVSPRARIPSIIIPEVWNRFLAAHVPCFLFVDNERSGSTRAPASARTCSTRRPAAPVIRPKPIPVLAARRRMMAPKASACALLMALLPFNHADASVEQGLTMTKSVSAPPPQPSLPPPSWPASWSCFVARRNLNLQDPLNGEGHDNRCAVRYDTLEQAKVACVQRSPEWYDIYAPRSPQKPMMMMRMIAH